MGSLLLRDMHRVLSKKGKMVTVALHPGGRLTSWDYVDRVHLMTYDFTRPTIHQNNEHASFGDTENAADNIVELGCPARKLVVGVPSYGRRNHQVKSYAEIFDQAGRIPESDISDEGYSFNCVATAVTKARLAQQKGYGGVFLWE